MYPMDFDREALQEVIDSNPGEDLVLSYSSHLYLGNPTPSDGVENDEEVTQEEETPCEFWTYVPSSFGVETGSVLT